MIKDVELPTEISEIIDKSIRIDTVAKKLDSRINEWQIWKSHDKSYELGADLYEWRNNLQKEFKDSIIDYTKRTPAVYDLSYLKPASDDGKKGLFTYAFPIYINREYLAMVDYETEGIMAVLDKEVEDPKIEVRGEDLPPLLHLPEDWSLLMEHSIPRMEMRTSVYARWQPQLTDTPRMIKIPDTLEIEWEFHNPEKAHTYTETEVLS